MSEAWKRELLRDALNVNGDVCFPSVISSHSALKIEKSVGFFHSQFAMRQLKRFLWLNMQKAER
jgi:hypothetical protein